MVGEPNPDWRIGGNDLSEADCGSEPIGPDKAAAAAQTDGQTQNDPERIRVQFHLTLDWGWPVVRRGRVSGRVGRSPRRLLPDATVLENLRDHVFLAGLDEADDFHLSAASRAPKRIDLVDPLDQGLILIRQDRLLPNNEQRPQRSNPTFICSMLGGR